MSLLRNLLGFTDDTDDDGGQYAPTPEKGSYAGQHRPYANPHPAHIYDDLTGLSKHEREVFEHYLAYGEKEAAAILGVNPTTLHKIVNVTKDKLDLHGSRSGVIDAYTDQFDVSIDAPYINYTPSENYTDTTVEGGENPWDYDSEGNYIGS